MTDDKSSKKRMTYAEVKAELDKLTPEQLAQPAVWSGDERGGYVRFVHVEPEDLLGERSDHETWVPRSSIGTDVDAADYADAVVCVPAGTVSMVVGPVPVVGDDHELAGRVVDGADRPAESALTLGAEPIGDGGAFDGREDQLLGQHLVHHRWNTSPSALGHPTLTAFLAERGGVDYLARKLQGGRGGERFSATKTALAIGRLIAERRLEDGREQLENRWDDEFPIPPHCARRYDEHGLPIMGHRMPAAYRSGRPYDMCGRPYDPLPYLTRDAARELWDKVVAIADDCGQSSDLFLERLPRELNEIVEEPWNELMTEQTHEDRALRDLILPALIEACRGEVATRPPAAEAAHV